MKTLKMILMVGIILLTTSTLGFCLTKEDALQYKGNQVTIIRNSTTTPYTTIGTVIDVITNSNGREFVMLQTNDYANYINGVTFIDVKDILTIQW